MSQTLAWFQIVAYAFSIAWGTGAALFTVLVLWPSIRRQNQLAVKMEAFFQKVEQRGVDKIIDSL